MQLKSASFCNWSTMDSLNTFYLMTSLMEFIHLLPICYDFCRPDATHTVTVSALSYQSAWGFVVGLGKSKLEHQTLALNNTHLSKYLFVWVYWIFLEFNYSWHFSCEDESIIYLSIVMWFRKLYIFMFENVANCTCAIRAMNVSSMSPNTDWMKITHLPLCESLHADKISHW